MATHFSILAWRIPWTEESGRLQSNVLQRVRHNEVTKHGGRQTHTHTQKMYPRTRSQLFKIVVGGGNGNPLWYSCLEYPWTEEPGGLQSMGSQSQTRLSDQHYSCPTMLISAVQQSDSIIHMYLLYSFPLQFIRGYWVQVPILHSRILLFIHSPSLLSGSHLVTAFRILSQIKDISLREKFIQASGEKLGQEIENW